VTREKFQAEWNRANDARRDPLGQIPPKVMRAFKTFTGITFQEEYFADGMNADKAWDRYERGFR
jgi:hypothetical protein